MTLQKEVEMSAFKIFLETIKQNQNSFVNKESADFIISKWKMCVRQNHSSSADVMVRHSNDN